MKKKIKDYIFLIAGCFLFSIAISAILIPSKIGAGGVTGIATSLNQLFGFRVGLTSLLINIPLFLFGFKLLGKKFAIRSGFIVFLSSMLIDFFSLHYKFKPFDDVLLGSLFCGVLIGIGIALIFMAGGSTGGLDISAKIINSKFPNFQLSTILLVEDILVYLLVAYVFGINSVLYAFILSFARTKTMDIIQEGISSTKQCIIICDSADELVKQIQIKLLRGVTVLEAKGSYSNTNKKFIYVVIQKNELSQLKEIVKSVDPAAFTTVSPVTDILGKYRNEKNI
ncbi:YitT family protein [Haloimpatiens lingqiaonensis]|uniref:YitT family protein n=1 Tax=Haloimpatiens lingqiaonensis TaxID=1380675 RepID=UPI0010FE1924|nr:YitT family protein [Haloimpatiens lingqiaonensis]